ncbi:hypothetical protein V6N13_036950 [Hibiscus sabdariffa]
MGDLVRNYSTRKGSSAIPKRGGVALQEGEHGGTDGKFAHADGPDVMGVQSGVTRGGGLLEIRTRSATHGDPKSRAWERRELKGLCLLLFGPSDPIGSDGGD